MHKHAEVLRAIADGKEVQYRHDEMPKDEWANIGLDTRFNPIFIPEWEWRIKPEHKLDRCFFAVAGIANRLCDVRYFSQDLQRAHHNIKLVFDGETNELKSVEIVK